MFIIRHLYCIGLLGLLFWLPHLACAQVETPASRWTVGVEIGHNILRLKTDTIWPGHSNTWNSVQQGNLTATYRITRWLGLLTECNFIRYSGQHTARYLYNAGNQSWIFNWDAAIPLVGFSAGPQFLWRVGQGDLAADFIGGMVHRTAKVQGVDANGKSYSIKYRGKRKSYAKMGISYTYWPNRQFGINIGGELFISPITEQSESDWQPKTNLEELYSEIEIDALGLLSPTLNTTRLLNLTIGVQYRM